MAEGLTSQTVRAARLSDLPRLVAALRAVQRDSGYPQRVAPTSEALQAWLEHPEPLARFVLDVDGTPCGHARVLSPRPYLTRFLLEKDYDAAPSDCLEVGQLFVAPWARRQGAGQALADHASRFVCHRGKCAVVAAIGPASTQRLYERAGFATLGAFDGKDGVNTVMIRRSHEC